MSEKGFWYKDIVKLQVLERLKKRSKQRKNKKPKMKIYITIDTFK